MLLFLLACAHRIPEPAPRVLSEPLPAAPGLSVCWVEFATGTLQKGLAVAHGAAPADVPSTLSGVVLSQGDRRFLVDGGARADLDAEFAGVTGLTRVFLEEAAKPFTPVAPIAAALTGVGIEPSSLTGGLITHGHFDHLGGLLDLPGLPVHLPEAELGLAKAGAAGEASPITPADSRDLLPRAVSFGFDSGPVLAWPDSHDLFGDGSVQIVSLAGHTPGSIGVWFRHPNGKEMLLVGDAVWVREGFEAREPKSWLAASFGDSERAGTDAQIATLWALHRDRPALHIVPAHDRRSWVEAFGAPGCTAAN